MQTKKSSAERVISEWKKKELPQHRGQASGGTLRSGLAKSPKRGGLGIGEKLERGELRWKIRDLQAKIPAAEKRVAAAAQMVKANAPDTEGMIAAVKAEAEATETLSHIRGEIAETQQKIYDMDHPPALEKPKKSRKGKKS